jgi:exodeoxyribonuclease III
MLRLDAFGLIVAWSLVAPCQCWGETSSVDDRLRVMTFNIWVGGESGGQPLQQTAAVITAAKADVVGVQESRGGERDGKQPDNGAAVAKMLGWHYYDQGGGTGVMSRYRITKPSPKRWGVEIAAPTGKAWLFNVHLAHAPYQPYQLLKIPYANAPFIDTADEAVNEALKARHAAVSEMLAEVAAARLQGTPIFVTGDFNEPSALDWTPLVTAAGRCPVAVHWPSSGALLETGFVDAYRQVHRDPLAAPGYTWTPITSAEDPKDRHDRIDFVLVGGQGAAVVEAKIVGENRRNADIVVTPYPSDHRGVVATVVIE